MPSRGSSSHAAPAGGLRGPAATGACPPTHPRSGAHVPAHQPEQPPCLEKAVTSNPFCLLPPNPPLLPQIKSPPLIQLTPLQDLSGCRSGVSGLHGTGRSSHDRCSTSTLCPASEREVIACAPEPPATAYVSLLFRIPAPRPPHAPTMLHQIPSSNYSAPNRDGDGCWVPFCVITASR